MIAALEIAFNTGLGEEAAAHWILCLPNTSVSGMQIMCENSSESQKFQPVCTQTVKVSLTHCLVHNYLIFASF